MRDSTKGILIDTSNSNGASANRKRKIRIWDRSFTRPLSLFHSGPPRRYLTAGTDPQRDPGGAAQRAGSKLTHEIQHRLGMAFGFHIVKRMTNDAIPIDDEG